MKTIYITSLHLGHGGVEKIICNMANLFIKMGFKVVILCTYFMSEPVYYLDPKVKVNYLTDKTPNRREIKDNLSNFKLVKLAKELVYSMVTIYQKKKSMIDCIKEIEDSIIISTRNEHTVLINNNSSNSNKLIAQLHHDHNYDKKLLKNIKYNYSNFEYLLLLTDELTKEIETELRSFNDNIKFMTVPNFLVLKEYDKSIQREKQIISVGRLHSDKGFERLLNIWSEFIKSHPDYILKIVGDGPLKKKLEEQMYSLKLNESVILTGPLSNPETIKEIRKSKAYAMTSITEGFGLVLVESLSQGTPIVSFDVRVGPRFIIEDGYNGYLVEDNDNVDFNNKLDILIKDELLYKKISENSIKSSLRFNEESISKIWDKILS